MSSFRLPLGAFFHRSGKLFPTRASACRASQSECCACACAHVCFRRLLLALARALALWACGVAVDVRRPSFRLPRSSRILSRRAAARSNSSFSAASSISASSAAQILLGGVGRLVAARRPAGRSSCAWISSSIPRRIALTIVSGVIPCSALYSSCLVRRRLVSSMARCIECGDLVGVEHDLGVDMPRRPADRLDQRGLAPEEPLLVGVEDADHRDLGQVEPLAQQVDPHQGVEGPLAQLAEDRDPLEGIQLGVQPLAPQPLFLQVARQVLGQPLGQGGDQHPLAAGRAGLDLLEQGRDLPRAGSTRTIGSISPVGRITCSTTSPPDIAIS